LACERHLKDLKSGAQRGLEWKPEVAQHVIDFFPELLQLDADKPFLLKDWQSFIVGSLFGWHHADGTRRFRTAYVETGKGSGKTPMAAGIGIYGLFADGCTNAEIYSGATDREQARICFLDAKHMVERSAALREYLETPVASIVYPRRGSFFRPISSEHKGLDGKRVHMAILDELHEHPDAMVADKMRAGTKKDPNALIFEITNAGYNRESVCWKHREFSRHVLEGATENDSWFAYVCQLDEKDAWTDEKVWLKVNPSLPDLPGYAYLREQVKEAQGIPSKENTVKRLNFCVWTEQANRWIPMEVWDRNVGTVTDAELIGRPCFGGLDLASTRDLTALGLIFPLDAGAYALRCFFWMPEDNVAERVRKDRVNYDVWIRQGLIRTTPGNVTDYDFIRDDIRAILKPYRLKELAYDRWNATQVTVQLAQEWPPKTVVEFGQGFASMAGPTKEFEKLLMGAKLHHGGNPVLRWMASNVAITQDPAGNMKPDKQKAGEKIDGIVAGIMALGRATLTGRLRSVYEDRGLVEI
jgi:phage terminase large subunit-like protein